MKLDFNDILNDVKRHLSSTEIKAMDCELKDKNRINKLQTEIYLLWKYVNSGLKISRPPGKDCVLESSSRKYDVEIYQPDTSKVKALKNSQKNARVTIVGNSKMRSHNYYFALDDFLEEFISNVISNKKRKNQLTVRNIKNILWVDLSDISLIESLIIEDSDTFDLFVMKKVKQKLNMWGILDAVIISIWKNDEKIGILLNKNLNKTDSVVLSKAIDLKKII